MTFGELRARMQSPTKVTPKSGSRPVLAAGSAGRDRLLHLYVNGTQIQILTSSLPGVTVEPSSSGIASPTWGGLRDLDARRPVTDPVPH